MCSTVFFEAALFVYPTISFLICRSILRQQSVAFVQKLLVNFPWFKEHCLKQRGNRQTPPSSATLSPTLLLCLYLFDFFFYIAVYVSLFFRFQPSMNYLIHSVMVSTVLQDHNIFSASKTESVPDIDLSSVPNEDSQVSASIIQFQYTIQSVTGLIG